MVGDILGSADIPAGVAVVCGECCEMKKLDDHILGMSKRAKEEQKRFLGREKETMRRTCYTEELDNGLVLGYVWWWLP